MAGRRIGPGGYDSGFDATAAAINLSSLELEGEILGGRGIIKFEIGTHAREDIKQGEAITATARMSIEKAKETIMAMQGIIGRLESMLEDDHDDEEEANDDTGGN